jgi:Spy/CpxP family protein refolding chaperone
MSRLRVVLLGAAMFLLSTPWLAGQDKKDSDKDPAKAGEPAAKAKGQLPTYWKQLSLSDDQKKKVYEVQSSFRAKLDALDKQMKDLKDQERKELEKLLTDAQKARLREIITSKSPAETKTPSEGKP